MYKRLNLLVLIAALALGLNAQNEGSMMANSHTTAAYVKSIPALSTMDQIPAPEAGSEAPEKRRGANMAVPGKGYPVGMDPLRQQQQQVRKLSGITPILTFNAHNSGVLNDPTGAIGPNHYVNAYNSGFRIFDRSGNPLTNEASLSTLFPGETLGDPVVVYDRFADRFIIMEFSDTPNGILLAVGQGHDPVNDGWFTYRFNMNAFPDYEKLSIWSDGYYITANKSQNSPSTSDVVFALERDEMLLGSPSSQMVGFPLPGIKISGFYSPGGFNTIGPDLPPLGNAPIIYMEDDSWSGVSQDHLKIWNINVDWTTPSNSSISSPQELPTTPFDGVFDGGSFSNLTQPNGTDIDALQATVMYMTNYRRFSDYNSAVLNFVVDLDGTDSHAGIRWFELRQDNDGDPWTIYQEGTYEQPDGHSAFSGSISMDVQGNIGLAYTIVSETMFPSIRCTGRRPSDPLGTMPIEEAVLGDGNSNDPSFRYGDYAQLTVDPVDDMGFWHIGEYFINNSRTSLVGAFNVASEFAHDVSVTSIDTPVDGELSENEIVTITIQNFGNDPQSNIPVSYQLDQGAFVNEVFAGDINPGSSAQHTFSTTANMGVVGQEYTMLAATGLANDENTSNDTLVNQITFLEPNDIGVSEISQPMSGTGLGDAETVTVLISNFGTAQQSNFEASFDLDGMLVTETVAGPLDEGEVLSYSFSETVDLSEIGAYSLAAYTALFGDANLNNDTVSTLIQSRSCEPGADCSFGGGFLLFQVGSIDNETACSENGYGDYTDQITDLEQNSTYSLKVTTGYGNQYVRVWIDFNDNFVFDLDELVVDNYQIASGQGSGTFTENMPLVIPVGASLGQHIMRAKTSIGSPVPDDACEESLYGETEDYMAEVVLYTDLSEQSLKNADMVVANMGGNMFRVSMDSNQNTGTLVINLHNILGQKLVENRVDQMNGTYNYQLDMSYAQPGIYIVRLGNATYGKVKRIVVE